MTALLLAALLAAPQADPAAGPVVKLTAHPAAAPKPALKYLLLPEVRELKPGNPAQWYLRCFAEQRQFFFNREVVKQRASYRTMPLSNLRREPLENYGGHALTQADWAARLDTPDWQALDRILKEGADIRLPELGPLHELAVALQVRFRGEVARGDFDGAIRSAKTMLAFARHLGEYPALAATRLGLEVEGMALEALAEMVQEPHCPNLYWALTDLPRPLVGSRKGAQGDRTRADTELGALRSDAALTAEELEEVVGRISGRAGFAREQAGKPPRNIRAELAARAKNAAAVRAAAARLAGAGLDGRAVAGLPALQVILLDEKLAFESRRDDEMKLLGLRPGEVAAGEEKPTAGGLFADLLPDVAGLRRTQGRLEQKVALLRCVEALRLFAAAHGGKLPAKLADAGVPLPLDPFTGKPLRYELKGDAATLTAGAPKSEKETRYEIVIKE
jgi:hypothetical protein